MKAAKANRGVKELFSNAINNEWALYLSVITIGELRRGIELIRHRGDEVQAEMLASWLSDVINDYK